MSGEAYLLSASQQHRFEYFCQQLFYLTLGFHEKTLAGVIAAATTPPAPPEVDVVCLEDSTLPRVQFMHPDGLRNYAPAVVYHEGRQEALIIRSHDRFLPVTGAWLL